MPNPTRTVMGSAAYAGRVDPTEIAPVAADGPCPYGRSLSYATNEYSLTIGYKELTGIMELVDQAWEAVEDAFPIGEALGEQFAAIMEHVESLRQWTGWGGVPGKYIGNDV